MKRLVASAILVASIALLGLFLFPRDAEAQAPGRAAFASNMTTGLDSWRGGGHKAAIRRWLQSSPLAKDKGYVAGLENDLGAVESAYGKPRSFAPIHNVDLTPNIRVNYMGVHLEKGPLFMRFLMYRLDRGEWIISEIDYNVKLDPLITPLLGATAR